MSLAKLTLVSGLAAIALSACGTVEVKPKSIVSRGRVEAPTTSGPNHLQCLLADGLPARQTGPNDLVIGSVRVHFDATPGAAQADQFEDREQAAEVIGSALVYPGNASDAELSKIEACVAQGVKG
ncbi:MAG TPA: hypothetical protein VE992_03220 [Solirubrobacteraceae bacterium]|nr:hypothetical protein [Solirubrobacteraceae bacterium]